MATPDRPENSHPDGHNDAELPVPLLYRDAMMLVIDKPAGLPSHRGPQAKRRIIPVLTDYLDALRFGLPRKPEAAHRLDKDTSGCLLLGRHPRAMAELNQMFRDGTHRQDLLGNRAGPPCGTDEGLIDLPLGQARARSRLVDEGRSRAGLPSQTRYRVLGRGESEHGPLAWMSLEPLTGRTHQLRVHCQASGWPMLGDEIYGDAPREGGPGLQLHARAITIPLYKKRDPVTVEAPPPPHMLAALRACGWKPEG